MIRSIRSSICSQREIGFQDTMRILRILYSCILMLIIQADWITKVTQVEHYPDYVIELTKESYDKYFQKNPKRNVLVMFYEPSYEQTHYVVSNFYRNAYAFHDEYRAVFARFNCGKASRFCSLRGVKNVLEFKFIPAEGNEYDGEELKSLRGERITDFMNRHIGTNISGIGGLNEMYGRSKELDSIAHQFMETVIIGEMCYSQNSEETRMGLMKKVVRLRKRFHYAGKYYSIMKKV